MKSEIAKQFPASIRIFGYGEDVEPVIDWLGAIIPAGVEAIMMNEGEAPEPTEYDKMVIFLMSDYIDDTCNACCTFYQADVLSIIVHTPHLKFRSGAADCYIESTAERMTPIVEALIGPMVNKGPVNYDLHELRILFKDSFYGRLWSAEGDGRSPLKMALGKINREISPYFKMESERLAILISCNPSPDDGFEFSEMVWLTSFISGFNDGIDARWGFYFDPRVEPDKIRVTAIITGKLLFLDAIFE